MKKLFSIIFISLAFAFTAHAQIVISSDFIRNPESEVKIRLLDSITNQPLVMATVFLQPKGDTTIMYFNLTDTSGTATLEGVVRGNYKLTAEYLGYQPFVKELYFKKQKEDLGTVKMVEDAIMLEAATVNAVGNAIEVKQDTIVYNATMFRTADNAVLGELLKKMPGFEVSESGQVKVNGQSVSKITVNGKTFFFDDPTMAVKNLPAKIVDKIKITDAKSDSEKSTGIADMSTQKQKEMDISLKKEYEQGWFGNAKLAAGAPIDSESDQTGMLVGGKDFMYNGNLMLSGYNQKDQLTIIGNLYNTPNIGSGDYSVYFYGGDQAGRTRPTGGLTTNRQLGANLNTSRIKGFSTSAVANYKGNLIESQTASQRTTFNGESPDMLSSTNYRDNYNEDDFTVSLELANTNREKVYARISPKFEYASLKRDTYTQSTTSQEETLLNSSDATSYLNSDYMMHSTTAYVTLKNLGKEKRSITLNADYNITNDDAQSKEYSNILYAASNTNTIKDLYYKSATNGYRINAKLTYVEPLGKNWNLSTMLQGMHRTNNVTSNAYRRNNADDKLNPWFTDRQQYSVLDNYYSSVSDLSYMKYAGNLLMQYKKGDITTQFGAAVEAVNNTNYSKSYGMEQTTGKGEYLWNVSPYIRFSHYTKNGSSLNLDYSGSSTALSNSQISTVPNISNPTNISVGNVYLNVPFNNNLWLMYSYNNRKNFSYTSVYFNIINSNNEIVYANWFDKEGVQYNVPVNSRKASNSLQAQLSISSLPLNKDKTIRFRMNVSARHSQYYSYQSTSKLQGIDINTFSYKVFMQEFWGNASGNRFYNGESGFKESKTKNTNLNASIGFSYKGEKFNAELSQRITNDIVKYSLNKNADMNTWQSYSYLELSYITANKFNFTTDASYTSYKGYTNGYGQPVLNWDFEASKSIKAVTFGLRVKDILNQTTNFNRNVTGTYVEDTYKNIIGRHFLITFTYNFGKMNSGKNRSATNAALNMMM